jgi:hypothetical protein
MLGSPALALFKSLQKKRQRAIENDRRIAIRGRMPHQRLDAAKPFVGCGADRELHLVNGGGAND